MQARYRIAPRLPRHTARGFSLTAVAGGLVVLGVVLLTGWYFLPVRGLNRSSQGLLTQPVSRGAFTHVVTERGEVESSNNVEVRCEVQSRNSSGTVLINIVREGTNVEAGDFIAKFDDSALQNEKTQQQIACNTSDALVIQARNVYETAKIAKQEYEDGTFKQEEQIIESEIFVSEENLRRAQEYAVYSERLAAKGYVTPLQLEADKFAVKKAEKDLGTARTKLDVLRNFTRKKMLVQLEADIETAKAKLEAEENSHKLDLDKLALISTQIEKCEVRAPAAGQVVYANETDRRGGSEVIIQEGILVRERQVIARLPNPKKMQVRAKISESRIEKVQKDMRALVRIDALPEVQLTGTVSRVDDFPLASGWFNTNIKEYATIVEIHDAPENLRPGMTAEVRIHVEQIPDAVQVPVQAVVEHGGHHFCLVSEGEKISAREVTIGSTNDKTVVIPKGLKPEEIVLVNPRAHLDKVTLPELPEQPAEVLVADRAIAKPEPSPSEVAAAGSPREGEEGENGGRRRRGRGGPGGGGGVGAMGATMDPQAFVGMIIQRMDKDGDGRIGADELAELPEERRVRMTQSDTNGDGFIDSSEMGAAMARMAAGGAGFTGAPQEGPSSSTAQPSGGGQ